MTPVLALLPPNSYLLASCTLLSGCVPVQCQCARLRLRGLEMRSVSDALRCAQEQPEKRGEAEGRAREREAGDGKREAGGGSSQ